MRSIRHRRFRWRLEQGADLLLTVSEVQTEDVLQADRRQFEGKRKIPFTAMGLEKRHGARPDGCSGPRRRRRTSRPTGRAALGLWN
jgi:hypothetical protein